MMLSAGLSLTSSPVLRRYSDTATPALGPYLPSLAAEPLAVWGMKRMVAGHTGPLFRLRRADNAEADFAATADGDVPDYAAIATWAGGAACYVTTRYDQSGNGVHSVQANATSQPRFDPSLRWGGIAPGLWDSTFGNYPSLRRKFMIATGTFSTQDLSVWQVKSAQFSSNQSMHWNISSGGASGTTLMNCYQTPDTAGLQFYDGSGNITTTIATMMRAQPAVHGFNMGASGRRLTIREQTFDYAASAANVGDTFASGYAGQFGNGYETLELNFGEALYPSLSNADQATFAAALAGIFGIASDFDRLFVFTGDSIMDGWGVDMVRSLPHELLRQDLLPGTPEVFNTAIAGQTMAQDSGRFATFMAPLCRAMLPAEDNRLIIESGTNDIEAAASVATLQSRLDSFALAAKTAGFTVGAATLLPYLDPPSGVAGRSAYNAWLLADSSNADFVIDTSLAPHHDGNADTAWYQDAIHPAGALQAELAEFAYGPALAAR